MANVGFHEYAALPEEMVEFRQTVAGYAGEDVMFDVVIYIVRRDGESFPPAGIGRAGVERGVGIELVGYGTVLSGISDSHVEHVACEP